MLPSSLSRYKRAISRNDQSQLNKLCAFRMKQFRTSLHVSPSTTTTKRLRARLQCSTRAAVYDHDPFRKQCTSGNRWRLRSPYYSRHETDHCMPIADLDHRRSLEVSRPLRAKNLLAFTVKALLLSDAKCRTFAFVTFFHFSAEDLC